MIKLKIIFFVCMLVYTQFVLKLNAEKIVFTYYNQYAKSVSITGSFNNWSKTANVLKKTDNSKWLTEIELPAGEYEYKFIIDKKIQFVDLLNPRRTDNNNSRLIFNNSADVLKNFTGKIFPQNFTVQDAGFQNVSAAGEFSNWEQYPLYFDATK